MPADLWSTVVPSLARMGSAEALGLGDLFTPE